MQPPPPPPPPTPLQFPYPILNKLPFPLGFLGFVLLGFVVVLATFQLGKSVKRLTNLALDRLLLGSEGGARSGGGAAPAQRSNGRQQSSAAVGAGGKDKEQ